MTCYRDAEIAWQTVEHCRSSMRSAERTAIFVALGAGDYHQAIIASVAAVKRANGMLPAELHDALTAWANLIAEPVHRQLIDEAFAHVSVAPPSHAANRFPMMAAPTRITSRRYPFDAEPRPRPARVR